MQQKLVLAVLAALILAGGCAQRDPNLMVRSLGEFSRAPGDYTLSLKTYGLDDAGRSQLAAEGDASLSGFVTRTLSAKGYAVKAAGPAKYALEVHLLCGDTRTADKGLIGEELRLPAQGVPGYSEQLHYWLPEQVAGLREQVQEARERNDAIPRSRETGSMMRPNTSALGGAPLGRPTPDHCQGRVLVLVTPAGAGPVREVFVGRAATEDCAFAKGCPVGSCRNALEQSLVDLLERRF
jgi:hypothetical protein